MIRIASPSFHPGRNRPIRLVVLHTAETPCEIGVARNVATYLARPDVRASCHYSVGPDETVAQVAEGDTAWTAPGANADGVQIEQAGRASFTAEQWAEGLPELMVRTQTAPLVADICRRSGLPPVWLAAPGLLAGRAGITDHATVNEAYGQSDHWDCGPNYPGPLVATMAARIMGGHQPTGADMTEDERAMLIRIHGVLGTDYPGFGRPASINDTLQILSGRMDRVDATLAAAAPASGPAPSAAAIAAEIIRQLKGN